MTGIEIIYIAIYIYPSFNIISTGLLISKGGLLFFSYFKNKKEKLKPIESVKKYEPIVHEIRRKLIFKTSFILFTVLLFSIIIVNHSNRFLFVEYANSSSKIIVDGLMIVILFIVFYFSSNRAALISLLLNTEEVEILIRYANYINKSTNNLIEKEKILTDFDWEIKKSMDHHQPYTVKSLTDNLGLTKDTNSNMKASIKKMKKLGIVVKYSKLKPRTFKRIV